MHKDLTSLDWHLSEVGCDQSIGIELPCDNYSALQKSGMIPDPYMKDNEKLVQWVAQRDWDFSTRFGISAAFLKHDSVFLSFDCIDTVAEVFVNGKSAGLANNEFRRWRFEVKKLLKSGQNDLVVRIKSPIAAGLELAPQASKAGIPDAAAYCTNRHVNLMRKSQCSSGWDWGISLPHSGIYGKVALVAANAARIDHVWVEQSHTDGVCGVTAKCRLEALGSVPHGVKVPVAFEFNGQSRTIEATIPLRTDKFVVEAYFEVENPKLWWPNGYGEQPLYTLRVSTPDMEATRSVGLRDLVVINEPDAIGRPMTVRVNGVDIFAKGADWIPCDARPGNRTNAKITDLLESAAAANMNMLRLWGGGVFESDHFYDECDRLGIMLWHDMMFACMLYPSDKQFVDNVRKEVEYQVLRLRSHACIALWCGDNECIGAINWQHFDRREYERHLIFYDRLNRAIGEVVEECDPSRIFWPSSPCAGPGDFSDCWSVDTSGDMHFWRVWAGNVTFDQYYTVKPRFCSEFGFQSFPSLECVKTFATEEDFNVFSPIMDQHQRCNKGNSLILGMIGNYFKMPKDFESTLYISQVQQAEAMRTGVEYWRTLRPRCMGTLFWQLNDNWPVSSWSSVEFGGRWKVLNSAAARFYAPIATFVYRTSPDAPVKCFVVCDLPGERAVDTRISLHRISDGSVVKEFAFNTQIKAAGAVELDLESELAKVQFNRAEVFLSVQTKSTGYSHEGSFFFEVFKRCDLPEATVEIASLSEREYGVFDVVLKTDKPAFFVWLAAQGDPSARFSDNAFTMLPGTKTITVKSKSGQKPNLTLIHLRQSY